MPSTTRYEIHAATSSLLVYGTALTYRAAMARVQQVPNADLKRILPTAEAKARDTTAEARVERRERAR